MTADEILAAAAATRASIVDLDANLAERVEAIKDAAFNAGRALTPSETAERDQLRAARHEAAEALRALSFQTMEELNDSSTVQDLLSGIQAINRDMDQDLQRLEKITEFAEDAAKVADGLVQVAKGLATLAA